MFHFIPFWKLYLYGLSYIPHKKTKTYLTIETWQFRLFPYPSHDSCRDQYDAMVPRSIQYPVAVRCTHQVLLRYPSRRPAEKAVKATGER